MHEPNIAPLARRLAEENNVDWRRLSGSGDAGRVVERDVLGYLARVMAGEEAVDPTPEPVPDGMTAWPEDDVAAYRTRGDQEPSEGSPPTVEDDLFLFDDPLPPVSSGSDDPWLDGATGIDTATPDSADLTWTGGAAAPVDDDAVLLVGDEAGPADPIPDGDVWDADGLGFDLAGGSQPRTAEQVHTPGGRSRFDLPDLFAADDVVELGHVGRGTDLLFEEDEEVAGAAPTTAVIEAPLIDATTVAPSAVDTDEWRADTLDDGGAQHGRSAAPIEPRDDRAHEAPAVVADTSDVADEPVAVAGVPVDSVQGVAFVRHGQVWRRRFDDRALRKAVSEVAAELEAPVGVVTAVLLARAAIRAGAASAQVDALRWRDGRALRGAVAADGDFRGAVASLRPDPVGAGAASELVVADLSELDLDEAVLHLDAPVLTLSRSSGDGAWLTLSGDDVDGATVDALARVATLLAAPVRLLV